MIADLIFPIDRTNLPNRMDDFILESNQESISFQLQCVLSNKISNKIIDLDYQNDSTNTPWSLNNSLRVNRRNKMLKRVSQECASVPLITDYSINPQNDFEPFKEFPAFHIDSKSHPEEEKIIKKILLYKNLKKNWDGQGALPLPWESILNSMELFKETMAVIKNNVSIPYVSPLANGQIEFEWIGFYKELIFSVSQEDSKKIEFLTIEKKNNEEIEKEGVMYKNDFLELVIGWFLK
jgi:hypothetical protein